MDDNITFKISKSSEYINGEISYENNEFIFESNKGKGEFSIMLGKGYCELSIARFNSKIYSFEGMNNKEDWISKALEFPNSIKGELYLINRNIDTINYDGIWYTEDWNTYYDRDNNFICMGNYKTDLNDIAVEFCKNIVAVIIKNKLKSIWIKNINFKS